MLAERWNQVSEKGEKALVLFVTAGDPSLEDLPEILEALVEGGVDVIELGIPFSDPIADGPTIQASSQRALDRGVTPRAVLATLEASGAGKRVPVVLMGYLNPILRMGEEEFAEAAQRAGASGVLVTDLTPEESDSWCDKAAIQGLTTTFLVAPTSTDDRIRIACERTTGFVYAVSRTGVTGADSVASQSVGNLVSRIRPHTKQPVFVGFGISSSDQVREVCQVADGAIIGSSLVNWLSTHWNSGRGRGELIKWVRDLKRATQP